jgi:hypothetical protein
MAKRVFFSFHYQDVIDFRANVVRNHSVTKDHNGGFFDAWIWESAKKTGDIACKRLINSGLDNTSMTAVLVGSQTYARRWVHYEMIKSIERGNGLLAIHINSVRDKTGQTKVAGPNPPDYLGIQVSADGGTGTPTIWDGPKGVLPGPGGFFHQCPTRRQARQEPATQDVVPDLRLGCKRRLQQFRVVGGLSA